MLRLIAIAFTLCLSTLAAEAALIDRGGGLYYDDVLDITWDDNASPVPAFQYLQRQWANNLGVDDPVRCQRWRFWRLPTLAEYSHMYNVNGVTSATPAPFPLVQPAKYWSSNNCSGGGSCSTFDFSNGSTASLNELNNHFGWAVRDGDVVGPPPPVQSPVRLVYTTTITSSAIPGVAAGDTLTLTVIADNGGLDLPDLASQQWFLENIVSVTATVGTYTATYNPPHNNLIGSNLAFGTDADGNLAFASYQNQDSVSNTDLFSPTTADPDIKFYSSAVRDSQGRLAYYPIRTSAPAGWTLARTFPDRSAWRNAASGIDSCRAADMVDDLDSGTLDRGTYTVTGASGFPNTAFTTTVDGTPYVRFLLYPGDAGTLTFDAPIYALGFDVNPWCNGGNCLGQNSLGAPVSVAVDGVAATTYNLPVTDVSEFRGFVFDVPVTTFTITTNAANAWHGIDNVEAFYAPDADADGVADVLDNCTLVANPGQLDTDNDGYGNICDADLNNSGTVTTADYGLLRSVLGQAATASATAANADMNGSGTVTTADYGLLRARLGTTPGPSGLACAGTVPCPP
jgi:hypothetical protein